MQFSLSSGQQQAAEQIFHYLAVEDPLEKADAIFVAGGKTLFAVERAASLFADGYSSSIVFVAKTGKFTNPAWSSEAEEFHKRFLQLDVPEKALLWKSEATNTLEEAQIVVPFLQEHAIDPKRLLLVTRPYHQRRVFATFRNIYPAIQLINAPALKDYTIDEEGVNRLIGEVTRLQIYGAKGDLAPQIIPEPVLQAVALLRSTFPGI